MLYRIRHARHRGCVEYYVCACKNRLHFIGGTNIFFMERRLFRQGRTTETRITIYEVYLEPFFHERVGKVAADEPCPPRNDHFLHANIIPAFLQQSERKAIGS